MTQKFKRFSIYTNKGLYKHIKDKNGNFSEYVNNALKELIDLFDIIRVKPFTNNMKNTTIQVSDEINDEIRDAVKNGIFISISESIRLALLLREFTPLIIKKEKLKEELKEKEKEKEDVESFKFEVIGIA